MKYLISFILFIQFLYAHPHVFVDTELEIVIKEKSVNINVLWHFDEMTSQLMIMDFDRNKNHILDKDEMKEIKEVAFDNMKEFNYYFEIGQNKTKVKNINPQNFNVIVKDDIITYSFVITVNNIDLAKEQLQVSCFDEDNLIGFFLKKTSKVKTELTNIKLKSIETKLIDRDFYVADVLHINWSYKKI